MGVLGGATKGSRKTATIEIAATAHQKRIWLRRDGGTRVCELPPEAGRMEEASLMEKGVSPHTVGLAILLRRRFHYGKRRRVRVPWASPGERLCVMLARR